ncbi:unnamed protein product [Discosporangium mesarthrocarpum]
MKALEKAFSFYDEDNSNTIDTSDLQTILRALGQDPTKKELKTLMRKADTDRSGVLQFDEFQAAMMPFLLERVMSKQLTEGEMRGLFEELDADKSGTVSRAQFVFLFSRKLRVLSVEESEALLSLLDRWVLNLLQIR